MIQEVIVPYLDVPVFSAVLLVISGILIANALWYMWRDDPSQAGDRLRDLQRPNETLQATLERQRGTSLRWDHPLPESHQLSTLPEQVTLAWERRQQAEQQPADAAEVGEHVPAQEPAASAPAEEELAQQLATIQQLRQQLDQQRQQLAALEEEKQSAAYRQQAECDARQQLEQQLQQAQEESARLRIGAETLQSLRTTQGSLQSTLQAKEARLRNVQAERDDAVAAVTEARKTIANLRGQVKSLRETSERIRSEGDTTRAELESQQLQREALLASLQEHAHAIEQFQTESRELKALRQEQIRLRAAHSDAEARERRAAQALADLQCQIPPLERTNQVLKRHADKVSARLRRTREQRASLAVTLRNTSEALRSAEKQALALQPLREELSTVEMSLQESLARLRYLEAERDEALSAETRARQAVGRLQEELAVQREQLEQLVRDQEQTLAVLQRERLDRAKADATLRAEQDSLANRWDDTLFDTDAAVERMREERNRAVAAQTEAQVELTRLRALLQDREQTLEQLRRSLVEGRPTMSPADPVPAAAGGRRDPQLGWVYLEPPEAADDLRLISGVAESLEQKLNELGVYTYQQVMEWDATAIDEFSRRLGFKDRIRRDDWVGQARRLHEQKHRRVA